MTLTPESWSDAQRYRAAERIRQMRARADIVGRYSSPADLLGACVPGYVVTPAISLMADAIETVLRGRRLRLMITAPPQEGKSALCSVGTPLRALQLHPDWRVMLLTYADGLAEEHSRRAREMIVEHGTGVVDTLTGASLPDRLGLSLRPGAATSSNWLIAEGDGGMVAAGRDATITGKRADLLIVDDPLKNMQEADSAAMRAKIVDWFNSVATTRLSPAASVIVINTRWHPEDLSGHLLEQDRALPAHLREWRYLNIPAVSAHGIPDALGRPVGVALESARGRTPEDFAAIERGVGRRVWAALYQGVPTPPEGGLFSASWFAEHRLDAMPDRIRVRVVAVDPAESGTGDEAGVIAAALTGETPPRVILTHDRSARMTSDQWADAAVELALDTDASAIYVETYTAGTTYTRVVRTALAARKRAAVEGGDTVTAARVGRIVVHGWRGSGDSVARSGLLRQAVEVGTCVVLGHELAELEEQARLWQVGSHQPDRVAAAVIAHERLVYLAGAAAGVAAPLAGTGRTPPAWLSRSIAR